MRFCRNLHISPHFKRFPYPPYKHVNLVPVISKLIPFVIVTSYIALFCTNTWLLVQEKEIGMKVISDFFINQLKLELYNLRERVIPFRDFWSTLMFPHGGNGSLGWFQG